MKAGKLACKSCVCILAVVHVALGRIFSFAPLPLDSSQNGKFCSDQSRLSNAAQTSRRPLSGNNARPSWSGCDVSCVCVTWCFISLRNTEQPQREWRQSV